MLILQIESMRTEQKKDVSMMRNMLSNIASSRVIDKHRDNCLIFEKFYRASNTDVHNVKGFGLGLAYVKTIIDSHKGKIIVRSQLKAGSEFQVYLPYSQ